MNSVVSDLSRQPQRKPASEGNFYPERGDVIGPGMNERVQRLRKMSVETEPTLSIGITVPATAR